MELRRYLAILRRRWVLIVVTIAVVGAVAWARTPKTPTYQAHATLYIGARQFSISPQGNVAANNAFVLNDALAVAERLQLTFATMIRSEPIAQAALARANIPRSASSLVDEISVAPVTNTQLLNILVTDRSPTDARTLANAIAQAFVDKIQSFEPTTPAGVGTVPQLPAYVFEEAKLPSSPQSTGLSRNLIIAVIFGFLLAAAVAFLLEYLDLTIKSPVDAERHLELPVLGSVPLQRQSPAIRRRAA